MSTRKKILEISIGLSTIVIISTFMAWLLGYQGFLLIGNISIPYWTMFLTNLLLFYTTLVMWVGISVNEYSLKTLKITFPYIGIYILTYLVFGSTPITYTVFPFVYIMYLGYRFNDFKGTNIRSLKYFIIVLIYQSLSSLVKVGLIHLDQVNFSFYQSLVFSIDSIIFQGLLFLWGGEFLKHGQLVKKIVQQSNYSSDGSLRNRNDNGDDCNGSGIASIQCDISSTAECSNESITKIDESLCKEYNSLNNFQQKFTLLMYLGIQFIQCLVVIGIINVVNLFFLNECFLIKSCLILISFGVHGLILKDRWHSNSIIVCSLVSSTMFFIASILTPSFALFQLFPIMMGLLLSYSMYKITQMKKRKTFQKWYDAITNLTIGRYAEIGNHKEVALAKGLTELDLPLVGYKYNTTDTFSKTIAKLSPWNDGKYVHTKEEDSSAE